MDVKELLKGCEEMNKKLTGVQQELEACRKRAKKEPEKLEHMTNRTRVLTTEARAIKRQVKAAHEKVQIELLKLTSMNERQVLTMRYLDNMTYKEISDATSFSLRSIYRMHCRGVDRLVEKKKAARDTQLKPPA